MKKLVRNPDVNWRVESHREAHVREVLEDPSRTGEDAEAEDVGTVTILDSGVMHQLNLLGGDVGATITDLYCGVYMRGMGIISGAYAEGDILEIPLNSSPYLII